jgi:hypothetical protein
VMRIILLKYDYVIMIHIMFLGFLIIPDSVTSCDYKCRIMWDIA